MNLYFYTTDIGTIGITDDNGYITNVYFESDMIPQTASIKETAVIREAADQLNKYLKGKVKLFSLPLLPKGTDFMLSVWDQLVKIPYGKTASYQDIALAIDNAQAVRAVGLANNKNPLPLFIPCHRVIGKNGKLTGYRGGLTLKKKLLDLEADYGIF